MLERDPSGRPLPPTLQRPVRSNRGGYLRCPFSISPVFSEMAERHAASAHSGRQGHSEAHAEGHAEGHGTEANAENGRPWARAGVGAAAMGAKDRRAQQQLAERVYGAAAQGPSGGGGEAEEQSEPTAAAAVPRSERAVLQRVVPRGLRRGREAEGDAKKQKREWRKEDDGPMAPSGSGKRGESPAGQRRRLETGESPAQSEAPRLQVNRLRQLDAMRQAVLFGGKRKKK